MDVVKETRPFRVLIVGGGVAGLTLLNALQRAKIEGLLFERRDTCAPALGSAIGIGPHASRILDQMSIWRPLCERTTEAKRFEAWFEGHQIESDDRYVDLKTNHGYPVQFGARYELLSTLHDAIPDKSKILLNQHIDHIKHLSDRVTVTTSDGINYDGDIIVGADSVHSVVREHMWRYDGLDVTREQNTIKSEYCCLYAASKPVKGLTQAFHRVYRKEDSVVVIPGNDMIFWFIIHQFDKTYQGREIPRFTKEQATELIEKNLDIQITDTITVRDLYVGTVDYSLLPLEEAVFETWTSGRFACLGDAAHKFTPNIGQGGNAAIESAAALTNSIHNLIEESSTEHPALTEVEAHLSMYHTTRRARASMIAKISNGATRTECLATVKDRLLAFYILPTFPNFFKSKLTAFVAAAEKLNFLPEPEAAKAGLVPFKQPIEGEQKGAAWSSRLLVGGIVAMGSWYLTSRLADLSTSTSGHAPTALWLSSLLTHSS